MKQGMGMEISSYKEVLSCPAAYPTLSSPRESLRQALGRPQSVDWRKGRKPALGRACEGRACEDGGEDGEDGGRAVDLGAVVADGLAVDEVASAYEGEDEEEEEGPEEFGEEPELLPAPDEAVLPDEVAQLPEEPRHLGEQGWSALIYILFLSSFWDAHLHALKRKLIMWTFDRYQLVRLKPC